MRVAEIEPGCGTGSIRVCCCACQCMKYIVRVSKNEDKRTCEIHYGNDDNAFCDGTTLMTVEALSIESAIVIIRQQPMRTFIIL